MIGRPEYTLTLPPPCPTNRDHLSGPCQPHRLAAEHVHHDSQVHEPRLARHVVMSATQIRSGVSARNWRSCTGARRQFRPGDETLERDWRRASSSTLEILAISPRACHLVVNNKFGGGQWQFGIHQVNSAARQLYRNRPIAIGRRPCPRCAVGRDIVDALPRATYLPLRSYAA